jgi:endonuclease/exonuclease/phosphatase family metal-dependent hydrolase
MTYNIEDVRTSDLRCKDHLRLQRAAARIQALAPDVLLVNELTYDQPGDPGYQAGEPEGQNARRFVKNYLSVAQADSLSGLSYQTVMLPVNTGQPSGYDLNHDGRVVTEVPSVPSSPDDGSVAEQTAPGQAFGGDAWGFGTFPGQYGMALFVREDLTVLRDSIRTFRLFKWSEMPHAAVPKDSTNGEPWYSPEAWESFRLSSKSHWDVPVRLPDGTVLHVLASHPTPPAFDGPARRNERRNHDEIRLWVDYLSDRAYIQDDSSNAGGLDPGASFVVVGDLNADPDDESPFRQAVRDLLSHDRVHSGPAPTASPAGRSAFPNLDPDDTAQWGKRVDYVLPSANFIVDTSGVWRPPSPDTTALPVSDHFPVWVDIRPER